MSDFTPENRQERYLLAVLEELQAMRRDLGEFYKVMAEKKMEMLVEVPKVDSTPKPQLPAPAIKPPIPQQKGKR